MYMYIRQWPVKYRRLVNVKIKPATTSERMLRFAKTPVKFLFQINLYFWQLFGSYEKLCLQIYVNVIHVHVYTMRYSSLIDLRSRVDTSNYKFTTLYMYLKTELDYILTALRIQLRSNDWQVP